MSIYAAEDGAVYSAKQTDQRGSHRINNRTVAGEPVEWAGMWFKSQMNYKPFLVATLEAAARAYHRKTVLDRIVEATTD